MNEINRTFFHELGHFIAWEMNKLYFKGPEVIGIKIEENRDKPGFYDGDTKLEIKEGDKRKGVPDWTNLAETLAAISYGCIFQSYLLKSELEDCFSLNGSNDREKWFTSLVASGLEVYMSQIEKLEIDFLNKAKQEKVLEELLSLDFEKYLQKLTSNKYTIDLVKLKADTKPFIEKHSDLYKDLINEYRNILNQE